jgi:hypothetical protein
VTEAEVVLYSFGEIFLSIATLHPASGAAIDADTDTGRVGAGTLDEVADDVDGEMLRFIKISSICSSRSILVEVTASCSNGNNAGCLVGAANGSGKADRVLIDEPEPNVDDWLRAGSPLSESLGFMLMLQDLRIQR